MNSKALVSLYYNSLFHFCLLTYLNSTPSATRESGAALSFKFLKPELEKPSVNVRGKDQARLNEKLKSNKLKTKDP